ncbi:uncharacterized protein LOC129205587 [Grus americana]|uniref:uncharacterized protein LOC129205587 n=1 Tax=Grus americana TaxID=9117 RepID=UPI002408868A|nr:uncharacterized protein LOC129205587 [Grus americana]
MNTMTKIRDNQVYWTVWIRWPGTSDPQEYKALVDTAAQCTLTPSSHEGAEPTCISGATGGSQQLTVLLEAKVSLTGNEWQKPRIVTGPEAPCIPGTDCLQRGYFRDPKGYRWALGIAALETEETEQLSTLPSLSEDPSAEVVSEKGKTIVQILLKAGFAINLSKVKGPAQEIQFLGKKRQDWCRQIPVDVINKIAAMSPPTRKKETQAFLGVVGFWRMRVSNYSLIVSPLYQVTWKQNDFKQGPEQRQAFEQIKQEIVHAVALGPVRAGADVKNVLYTVAGENGPSWSPW